MPRINRRKRSRRVGFTPDEAMEMAMMPDADWSPGEVEAFEAHLGDSDPGRRTFESWKREHDSWKNRPNKSETQSDRYWRSRRGGIGLR